MLVAEFRIVVPGLRAVKKAVNKAIIFLRCQAMETRFGNFKTEVIGVRVKSMIENRPPSNVTADTSVMSS